MLTLTVLLGLVLIVAVFGGWFMLKLWWAGLPDKRRRRKEAQWARTQLGPQAFYQVYASDLDFALDRARLESRWLGYRVVSVDRVGGKIRVHYSAPGQPVTRQAAQVR